MDGPDYPTGIGLSPGISALSGWRQEELWFKGSVIMLLFPSACPGLYVSDVHTLFAFLSTVHMKFF